MDQQETGEAQALIYIVIKQFPEMPTRQNIRKYDKKITQRMFS